MITMVEVVIMEAVGMVTNLHTVEVMETHNLNTTVDTDKDTRLNMVEVRFYILIWFKLFYRNSDL
jgi:hypothetical protein